MADAWSPEMVDMLKLEFAIFAAPAFAAAFTTAFAGIGQLPFADVLFPAGAICVAFWLMTGVGKMRDDADMAICFSGGGPEARPAWDPS